MPGECNKHVFIAPMQGTYYFEWDDSTGEKQNEIIFLNKGLEYFFPENSSKHSGRLVS